MPAVVNRLTAAGKAARRRKAMIYRDFPAAADRFAHRGKPKTAAVDKHFVVVFATSTGVAQQTFHVEYVLVDPFHALQRGTPCHANVCGAEG